MKNLCIFCPIVWRLDQISGTVRPCNWSSPDMVPLSRPPVFVPNSTLVTCLLEEFWAGRWQSPPKAVLNLNLSDLLLRKPEIYIAERKTSQKKGEPRCKSDSKFTKSFPPWKYGNIEWQILMRLKQHQVTPAHCLQIGLGCVPGKTTENVPFPASWLGLGVGFSSFEFKFFCVHINISW